MKTDRISKQYPALTSYPVFVLDKLEQEHKELYEIFWGWCHVFAVEEGIDDDSTPDYIQKNIEDLMHRFIQERHEPRVHKLLSQVNDEVEEWAKVEVDHSDRLYEEWRDSQPEEKKQ